MRHPPWAPNLLPHLSQKKTACIPIEPSILAVSSGKQETAKQKSHLLWERTPL